MHLINILSFYNIQNEGLILKDKGKDLNFGTVYK